MLNKSKIITSYIIVFAMIFSNIVIPTTNLPIFSPSLVQALENSKEVASMDAISYFEGDIKPYSATSSGSFTINYYDYDGDDEFEDLTPDSYESDTGAILPDANTMNDYKQDDELVFAGWSETMPAVIGASVTPIYSIPKGETGGKTFYANWEFSPGMNRITYYAEDGITEIENIFPNQYASTAITSLPSISTMNSPPFNKPGYTFLGWTSTNDDSDNSYQTAIETNDTGDKTFYANWKKDQQQWSSLIFKAGEGVKLELSGISSDKGFTLEALKGDLWEEVTIPTINYIDSTYENKGWDVSIPTGEITESTYTFVASATKISTGGEGGDGNTGEGGDGNTGEGGDGNTGEGGDGNTGEGGDGNTGEGGDGNTGEGGDGNTGEDGDDNTGDSDDDNPPPPPEEQTSSSIPESSSVPTTPLPPITTVTPPASSGSSETAPEASSTPEVSQPDSSDVEDPSDDTDDSDDTEDTKPEPTIEGEGQDKKEDPTIEITTEGGIDIDTKRPNENPSDVQVNGNSLANTDYSVDAGIVSIAPKTIASFGDGENEVIVLYPDGIINNVVIVDNGVPLSAYVILGLWSLFDVIMTVFSILFAVHLFVRKRKYEANKEMVTEKEKADYNKKKKLTRIGGVMLSVVSVALLFLTQDFTRAMNIFDDYSLWFAIISVLGAALIFFMNKEEETLAYHID